MMGSLPKPGCYANIASEEYHSWPAASSTVIRTMIRSSPAHAAAGTVDPQSPALRLGTAVHAAVLEPVRFDGLIRIEPKVDRRTKEGKQLWDSFQQSLMPGQTSISDEQFEVVRSIERNVRASAACTELLSHARNREYSVVSEVEGVMCKARCDAWGDGLVVDVKTTSSLASEEEFSRTVFSWGYALQAAFYRMVLDRAGLRMDSFAWIACETNPPYAVACYAIGNEVLDLMEPALVKALHRWSDCETRKEWPAYPDVVRHLQVPAWMRRELEEAT